MSKSKQSRPPTNTRRSRRVGDRNTLILVIITVVVVGSGLIAVFMGAEALITALPCLLGGAGVLVGLWLLLTVAEKWRAR